MTVAATKNAQLKQAVLLLGAMANAMRHRRRYRGSCRTSVLASSKPMNYAYPQLRENELKASDHKSNRSLLNFKLNNWEFGAVRINCGISDEILNYYSISSVRLARQCLSSDERGGR